VKGEHQLRDLIKGKNGEIDLAAESLAYQGYITNELAGKGKSWRYANHYGGCTSTLGQIGPGLKLGAPTPGTQAIQRAPCPTLCPYKWPRTRWKTRRKIWNSNARTANIGNTTGKEAISAIVGDTPHVLVNMVIGRKRDKTIGAVSLSATPTRLTS
jgi:hypothetical protein